jgi:hypothetical protein
METRNAVTIVDTQYRVTPFICEMIDRSILAFSSGLIHSFHADLATMPFGRRNRDHLTADGSQSSAMSSVLQAENQLHL